MNYHYFLHLVFPYSLLLYIYSKEEGKINKRLNSRFSSNEIRNQKFLGNPETILKKKGILNVILINYFQAENLRFFTETKKRQRTGLKIFLTQTALKINY